MEPQPDFPPDGLEPFAPHPVLRGRTATQLLKLNPTIVPYIEDLNGINQPLNLLLKDVLYWMLAIAVMILLSIRIIELLWAKLRHVSSMTVPREKQEYWKFSQWSWMPFAKRHIVYAALVNKRHHREIRLSSAINVGIVPSRFQTLLLSIYIISNVVFICLVHWHQPNRYALCAELRGRSGTLSIVNMVPLVILAGRNNPLIPLLQISFDTYNLMHRWLGRLVVAQVTIHFITWMIPGIDSSGWAGVGKDIKEVMFLASGFVGTGVVLTLFLFTFSPFRHAFYETFLNIHNLLAAALLATVWIHCATANNNAGLPQLPNAIALVVLWLADRLCRILRLTYVNWSSRGTTKALCEAMPGEVTRVTMQLPRYVDVKPGTHAYLRFWGVSAWQSHPFSIAWVEHKGHHALPLSEKEQVNPLDCSNVVTTVSFVIGARTGMTRTLYEKALKHDGGMQVRAAMEGPYAGHHSLDSYGHVVLIAGSTGITHQISYIRNLVVGYNNGTVATRRLTLVWIIREHQSLEWVRPFMDEILKIPNRKDILRIQVFVTRPQNPTDIANSSSTLRMFPGRPNIPLLLQKEVQEQIGAMCVSVCGPGSLADDVRSAARMVQGATVIDFIEESFSW